MDLNTETITYLRKEYGDAFYLLDSERFEQNYIKLKSCFASIYPKFNIAYSYKTNYIPKLCKTANELGGYAEIVSEMELELAKRLDVAMDKIIWNGPIKQEDIVEELLLGGGCVNVDSIKEVKQVVQIAENHRDRILNIGIRCNFDIGDGVISRFGLDVGDSDFQKALEIITMQKNIRLISFQCHFAKRQIDYWKNRAEGILKVIRRSKIIPERIDLGGGLFGYMSDFLKNQFSVKIPSYEEYATEAATVIAEYFNDIENRPELIIEPGSALVGDCMQFVGTVETIKTVRGKNFAVVLGSQKNISMSGVNPPVSIIPMTNKRKHYKNVDIVGYTCIEGDILHRGYSGELAEGDAVVITNCGSYSIVMKPPFILPNFPVLDISGNTIETIKMAETFEDIFHTYNF